MNQVNEAVMPKVGDTVKWIEPCDYSVTEYLTLHSQVINHKGRLWLNGCGPLDEIMENYEYEINPGFPYL